MGEASISVRDTLLAGFASGSGDQDLLTRTLGMDSAQSLHQDYKQLIEGACYGIPNPRLYSREEKYMRQLSNVAKVGYVVPTSHISFPDPSAKGGGPRILAKTFVALLKALCPAQWCWRLIPA